MKHDMRFTTATGMLRGTALALVLWIVGSATNTAAARETVNIGTGWTFFTRDDASTDGATTVNLPHVQLATGMVNYLKEIDVPAGWEDKRVFLRIGGAGRVTDVFVNGVHAATHRGALSPFTAEITPHLQSGTKASVRIVVDSSPGLDVLPTAGREKNYGGISRNVELIVCDRLSVSPAASLDAENKEITGDRNPGGGDGIWITTDRLTKSRAEGRVRLALLTLPEVPEGATARIRFRDPDGNIAAQSALPITTTTPEIPFALSNPHLWQGVEDPWLYDVEVTLADGAGRTTDSLTLRTGFRTVGIDSRNNVTLNGKPVKIHGVILHRDRMMVGTALTPFQTEEDVELIREMGANAVRVAGGVHNDYFYTLCNEAGIMVWNDGPFTGAAYPTDIDFIDSEAFKKNGRRQFADMISTLYNHPSVVAWGVFSNISTRGGDPAPYIRSLNETAHELDPKRLTAASSVSDGEVNFITDIVSFDLSLGWESGLPDGVTPWLEQLRKGWPDLRAGISYSAGASIFHQSERLERPQPQSNYHPEGWQTFFHEEYMRHAVDAPGVWGVFVGNMFDSGEAKATQGTLAASPAGALEGAIDDRGMVTFDRKDRKDAFWIYKANWNHREPFVRIAGSRLDVRSESRQTIHVYSNMPEVELFVGGRSQGRRTGESGIFVWENLPMRPGANRLEARGKAGGNAGNAGNTAETTHRISINISPTQTTNPAMTNPATSATTTPIAIPVH